MGLELDSSMAGCGNCGSGGVRNRVRHSRGGVCSAQVVCQRCGAYGALFVGADAQRLAAEDWLRRPASLAVRGLPAEVRPVPPVATARAKKVEERDPLELIARMVVGGSFRIPTQGRSTAAMLSAADVAGAVGMMRDPVAKQAATAVALRSEGQALVLLGRSAARRVFRMCRAFGDAGPLRLDDPADRWRLRLVLQDAVNDLVWPERKAPSHAAARAAKMRKADYLRVYRLAKSTLDHAVDAGRRDFSRRLFSR
ncbi:hypothetical protein [Stenotrophomonas geniculata]|uniref:hypothetical protein n=1 Tax=Stenotrophomonas geniculata TaxID=86188 RepID=UPI00070DEA10|nr:hypothetical protein [Stenotrophomonas geniculata]KRG43038.1 hypothetical protein ARC63_10390 [Stenotrophomonas geniculata ATCC 19374 = JCM 13324]